MAVVVVSPAEETYQDVEKLIYRLCWKFSKYGNEFEDCVSVANVAFTEAFNSFNPSRGCQFSTWVYHSVVHALQDFNIKEQKYRQRTTFVDQREYDIEDCKRHRLMSIIEELSDDARIVVQAVIESPQELAAVLRCHKPTKIRRGLWQHFKDLGWSLGRTAECFAEIREVLE
jgi:RNA polymerase sigma factor (sigma-70 family)